MKKNLSMFTLLALAIMLFSNMHCKKDNPDPANIEYVKLDPVFLSYFAFPNGSWWTYKEINSGKTDSFFVSNYNISIFQDKKSGDDRKYQSLGFSIKAKNKTFDFKAASDYIEPGSLDTTYALVEHYNAPSPNVGIYGARRFSYPSKLGESQNGVFSVIKYYDTLTVQGKLFKDIYQTDNSYLKNYNWIKSEYYCRNIGIIKKEYFDGTIWELINYYHNK